MRILPRLLLAILLVAILRTPAFAAWPNQPNLNLPVSVSIGSSRGTPLSISDNAGGAVVAWPDNRYGADRVLVHHLLASGSLDPAWPANGRLTMQGAPVGLTLRALVPDGLGGAIAVWTDTRSGFSRVAAQHILKTGVVDPAWPVDGRTVSAVNSRHWEATAVTDGAGGVLIVWQDDRNLATTGYDLYVHHILASGAVDPTWTVNGRVLCNAANTQWQPVAIPDGSGGAIVAWTDLRFGANYDIYSHHVMASGLPDGNWTFNGVPVCLNSGNQATPRMISDGASGALIAWEDSRSATTDIYAHHLLGAGQLDAVWPSGGRAVCTAAFTQRSPQLATDGSGGAIVAWADGRAGGSNDVYAQRLLSSGSIASGWPVDGRAVFTGASALYNDHCIVSDGAGGAIVAWSDARNGFTYDLSAARVLASGALDGQWATNGTLVSTAPGDQVLPAAVTDGAGGVVLVWQDTRNLGLDLYAQRMTRNGYFGTPGAEMAGVTDVPHDQGGAVRVAWTASYLEFEPYSSYVTYYLFRSVPTHALAQTAVRRASARSPEDAALAPGDLVSTSSAAGTVFWEVVTSFSGYQLSGYSEVTATTADSVAGGNPRTLFMVQTRAGSFISNSLPDSGYSVDNLAPSAPAPLVAQYAGGTARLHWNPNTEADLAGYRLYRGSSPAFSPSPATLVATPADTGWTDAANAPHVYKLTAVDSHGNESPVATVTPSGTTAVDGGPARTELALASAAPNPAARSTTLRFTLPSAARLSLGVFDASGRLVRGLAAGERTAGEHAIAWDLRDGAGQAVGAGLYFARLECAGRTLVRRIAVTR